MRRLIASILIIPVITIASLPFEVLAEYDVASSAVSGTTGNLFVADNNDDIKDWVEKNDSGEVGLVQAVSEPAQTESEDLANSGESIASNSIAIGEVASSSVEVFNDDFHFFEPDNGSLEQAAVPVAKSENIADTVSNATVEFIDAGIGGDISSETTTIDMEIEVSEGVALGGVNATSSIDDASLSAVNVPPASAVEIAAQWILDENARIAGKLVPSGKFEVGSKFKLCGLIKNHKSGVGGGIYGQLFYPRNAGFGPEGSRGRFGCGQMTGAVCRMEMVDRTKAEGLICDDNTVPAIIWADGFTKADVCKESILKQEYEVYCCDRELAYDDVAGLYETIVIAQDGTGAFSNALPGFFKYEEMAAVEVDFERIYYGQVDENNNTEAVIYDESGNSGVALPLVKNTGNTRVNLDIWQDDMGLGASDGEYNISYGVKVGANGQWLNYAPFVWTETPEILDIGKSAEISFSTFVLRYPEDGDRSDYRGVMKFEARPIANYACESSFLNESLPALNEDTAYFEPEPADTKENIDINASTTKETV